MKNGIKIAVFGLLQLAIAGQASAQLVIAPSNLALNLAPLPVVANKDIPKLDLVAIQSIEVQNVTELGLEQLASVKADSEASDSNQVAVSVTLASAIIPTPPSTRNNSIGDTNTNANISVVATNNNDPVINSTVNVIDKTSGVYPSFNGDTDYAIYRDQYGLIKAAQAGNNIRKDDTIRAVSSNDNMVTLGDHRFLISY
jgi:hypothetical protein